MNRAINVSTGPRLSRWRTRGAGSSEDSPRDCGDTPVKPSKRKTFASAPLTKKSQLHRRDDRRHLEPHSLVPENSIDLPTRIGTIALYPQRDLDRRRQVLLKYKAPFSASQMPHGSRAYPFAAKMPLFSRSNQLPSSRVASSSRANLCPLLRVQIQPAEALNPMAKGVRTHTRLIIRPLRIIQTPSLWG